MSSYPITDLDAETLWSALRRQAIALKEGSPCLSKSLDSMILQRASLGDSLASILAGALSATAMLGPALEEVFQRVLTDCPEIAESAAEDLYRLSAINPACPSALTGLLSFRGFQGVQLHRINHALWKQGQEQFAVLLQNWGALIYAMDIHPAARIGRGVFFDHGIGIVIGATAVVEDGASIWHGVTLGSTLTQAGDRHPKVRRNVTIGASAIVLGNIEVGEGAIVAASSVVLKPVAPGTVVAGNPARVVGQAPPRLAAIHESTWFPAAQ